MSLTGGGSVEHVALHPKAGFLVIGGQVVAYRYSEETKQLSVTNLEGGAIFKPLSDEHAVVALRNIQKL